MIDTLMAFWNQNRRKRAAQVMLTFFLMCISISLLFVAMSLPQWSHTHPQGSVTGRTGNKNTGGIAVTTPTVIVQITQGPEVTPTSTIIVPRQVTPTPSSGASSCTTPDAQVNANATTYPNTFLQQTTPDAPVSQGASPVTHTTATPTPGTQGVARTTPTVMPSVTLSPTTVPTATIPPTSTVTPTATTTSTPTGTPTVTPTSTTSNGTPPHMPSQQQSGGGPINLGTPVSASPVPGLTPTTGTQHIGGGWISACNGNDIGMVGEATIVLALWQHIWLILAASLACTALFYAVVWHTNRKRL
jgi:hypothetical protein